ncbi:hypothetical protein UFOVP585_50 [uncultured Caudovirales phage]|uniref:Uncharacterized protein n=1 Tax=uncultured Caudovirales phage TaxID=2100421 RepID=A0A6J5MZW4_9CAUD|nr:hypothetical protein UFOVP585_50 [uncultured Caudovirales phage]
MNYVTILISILGLSAIAGSATVWFRASAGKANKELLESNIKAYQDAIGLKDREIAYLQGQVDSKDRTIAKLSEVKK